MTPTPNNLWALQGQLFGLLEARDESIIAVSQTPQGSEARAEAEREVSVIERAIADFVQQKISEVTEVRASYFALLDAAGVAKAEAARATNRQLLMEHRAARLKDTIKMCMETIGASRFDSAMGAFLIKGNGGAAPVTITDDTLLPDEFVDVTIKMGAAQWRDLIEFVDNELTCRIRSAEPEPTSEEAFDVSDAREVIAMLRGSSITRAPRKSAIAKALASEPIAGARIEERGTHLEIK